MRKNEEEETEERMKERRKSTMPNERKIERNDR